MQTFAKQRFYSGVKFKLSAHGIPHELATVDFDTGECEDDDGCKYQLESIFCFCESDGTFRV